MYVFLSGVKFEKIFASCSKFNGDLPTNQGRGFQESNSASPAPCVWRTTDFPRISNSPHTGRKNGALEEARFPDEALNEKGPSPFEPGPSSHVVVKLLLDFRLPRPCRRPIAFTETLATSAIPPLDETRSQVVAPAIAANQFV